MLDLTREEPIPLAIATRFVPPGRNGKRTHISTLLRWILSGVKVPGGHIVKLDALRLGGRWVTSREAIQRFAEALTPRPDAPVPSQTSRTAAQRRRDSDRAGRELDNIGIKEERP